MLKQIFDFLLFAVSFSFLQATKSSSSTTKTIFRKSGKQKELDLDETN